MVLVTETHTRTHTSDNHIHTRDEKRFGLNIFSSFGRFDGRSKNTNRHFACVENENEKKKQKKNTPTHPPKQNLP
jgi:hypothetical protein